MRTLISRTTVHKRQAWRNPSMSSFWRSLSKNLTRLIDARLHAVSSRNMYSEHGFDALMRPLAGQVCQSLIVVSNWTPGSAHSQAASQMSFQSSRARTFFETARSVRRRSSQTPSFSSASKNALGTRTELLEFWPETVAYASPLKSASNPAPIRMRALRSSSAFQRMNASMSGWSRSRQTIFAARRVVPPLLIAPAARSPILRKDMSPDETPPPARGSPSPRIAEKFVPVPDPYLKRRASRIQRSMIPPRLTRSSLTDWMKQAWG